jgi:hypothetical protein
MPLKISRFISASVLSLTAAFTLAGEEVVTKEQQAYKNTPGNEFKITFRSVAYPDGKEVTIDPDDTMPVVTKAGKVTLAPRVRFMLSVNRQLPAVQGELSGSLLDHLKGTDDGASVDGKSVTVLMNHLTSHPTINQKPGHGISSEDINEAIRLCFALRGLTPPPPKTQESKSPEPK